MRINEDYLDTSNIIDEKHGLMNTDDTAFNQLVERINKAASLFPNCGKPVSSDDEITSHDDWKILNRSTIRKIVYTDTGLDWLPVLNVYFAEYQKGINFMGKSDENDKILIITYPEYKNINYTSTIAHEIRHCHTYIKTDNVNNSYKICKSGMSWKNKEIYIDRLEEKVYAASCSQKFLDALKIDKDKCKKNSKDFRIYPDTTIDTVFNTLFGAMYYFQTTEMNSYLESFNEEIKKEFNIKNFYRYNTENIYRYSDYIYKQLYKYLETVRDKFDTVELGNMHKNILGSLSMKVYASKRRRDVREDDPKDLKIWIDYKMEQIKTWLKKANAIKLDIISKCMNKVDTYQINMNGRSFNINTTYLEYLNFIWIISRIVPEIIRKNTDLRLEIEHNYKHLMPEHTIKLFSDRILKKGITADNISRYMPQLIKAWEKYTKQKNRKGNS